MTNKQSIKSTYQTVILVTGLSGAGRSTCLKTLEDYGFEAIDNIPRSFIPALLEHSRFTRPLHKHNKIAIGIDARTRDFDEKKLLKSAFEAKAAGLLVSIVFLDCDDDTLIRRFTETRRKHPLSGDLPVIDGIRIERQLLSQVREKSDLLIDSSNLSLPQLHSILRGGLGLENTGKLTLSILSFGFRNGLPREADKIFDVRFLSNPHYDDYLRPLDGRNDKIAVFIEKDPNFLMFFGGLKTFLTPILPCYENEGKSYLTIGIGCTGGRHRSVFVAEKLNNWLEQKNYQVSLRHRDLIEDESFKLS